MDGETCSLSGCPAISAIYFALLQNGYDFYAIERDLPTVNRLGSFISPDRRAYPFFSEVRQNTCAVYPYWPRAALLETAAFYTDSERGCFADFDAYQRRVLSAENISDAERNAAFWDWIPQFPAALKEVLQSGGFRRYLEWETAWTAEQNRNCQADLNKIADVFAFCKEKWNVPFQRLQIVLNPIKCVYSADYHLQNETFIVCSGAFREEPVIHELLHHAVHPAAARRKDEVLRCSFGNLELDASYYLDGGEAGKMNAFEEYLVRRLTDKVFSGDAPEHLDAFLDHEILHLQ